MAAILVASPTTDLLSSQARPGEQLSRQAHLRYVRRGELVGDGHPVGGAKQVQLHPVDGEGAPPHSRRPVEARRLLDLAGVQHRKQRRVDDECLRLAHKLGQDEAPEGLQEAPELAKAAV